MKRIILACVALSALGSAALAADLSRPQQPYYKAPVDYTPAFSWTGFYLGINGGGGWGTSSWTNTGNFNTSGGMVGGTIGYNYQVSQFVLGIEGDIDWANMSGNTTSPLCVTGCTTSDSWLGTVRGRLGYAADRFMPFVTGGAAFGDIQASSPGFAGGSQNNAGWTVGGGLEFAFAPHWSAKAEYLYVNLGNFTCNTCQATPQTVSFTTNLVRGGINYHF